jgi:trans-2,3-dihydro-3-hydroxyanthranilate isomerase
VIAMNGRRYFILDVFTGEALAGNPLAVVLDCEGLDAPRMQAIAREFNLSETVFVLPPEQHGHRARLRIFMPHAELPFAGHPTVGTAVLLAGLDEASHPAHPSEFIVEEAVGAIPCVVRPGRPAHATFRLPRLPGEVGAPGSADVIAAALGLLPRDIGLPGHQASRFSAGNPFTFVPIASREAIGRVRANPLRWAEAFGDGGHAAAFLYTRETVHAPSEYHARMLEPGLGEDPATGSAVAAFAGVVMRFDRPRDGRHALQIEQGFAMGRPSLIELGIEVAGGALRSATIGGTAVIVAEGKLFA